MGPAATHKSHTFPCSPPPDYRLAALRVKDACGAGSAGQAYARSLTPPGPLTRKMGQLPGNRARQAQGKPAGQPGMPRNRRKTGTKGCIPAA
jgi:hypothetical protein